MGADNYSLDSMPGWLYNSIGYHADDGKLFCENGGGTEFGPTCTDGDQMGCGVDFRDEDDSSDQVKVFFTKNGQLIGGAIRIKIPAGGLYPLIGMCSEGEKVQYIGHWHFLPPTPTGIITNNNNNIIYCNYTIATMQVRKLVILIFTDNRRSLGSPITYHHSA